LFAMVAEDLPGATYALLSGNNEVLGVLAERDQVIDVLYREIDQLASREILLQAPVASTCGSCCQWCASCPSSSAPTTSWSRSPHGPVTVSVGSFRRAADGWSSGWGTWHGACGARPPIPGATATVLSRWRWASVINR
jgi:hypothetical protein